MFKKCNGVRIDSSKHAEYLEELKRNHESEELKELLARGYKAASAKKRPRVKSNEVVHPVKVVVTAPNCDWTLTVTWEHFKEKGGNCKIVKRYYK